MKENKVKFLKRYLALFISILIVFVTSIAGLIVYAEYTKSSRAKRVIASYADVGSKFSSNKLREFEDLAGAFNKVIFLANSSKDEVVERITICNYAQGDSLKANEVNIRYQLKARLVAISGNTKTPISDVSLSVLDNIDDNLSVTIVYNNQTQELNKVTNSFTFSPSLMNAGVSQTDVCKVIFSKEFNTDTTKVALEIYTELDGSYSGIKNLSGIFTTEVGAASNTWEGYFSDSPAIMDSEIKTPGMLDGYNYIITGNGKVKITLTWNSNKLKLNMQNPLSEVPAFTNENHSLDPDTGIEKFEFNVDSELKSSYRLQFYKGAALTESDLSSWKTFKEIVVTEFEPQAN